MHARKGGLPSLAGGLFFRKLGTEIGSYTVGRDSGKLASFQVTQNYRTAAFNAKCVTLGWNRMTPCASVQYAYSFPCRPCLRDSMSFNNNSC